MNDLSMTTPQFTYLGIFFGLVFVSGIVAILYRLNTGIRRGMKQTGDDKHVEDEIQAGDTLHAEGIYGKRHHEGGLPLRQEHGGVDLTKGNPGLRNEPNTRVNDLDQRNTPYTGEKI